MSNIPRVVLRLAAGLAATLALCVAGLSPAHAAESVASYVVAGSIAPDGSLAVKATITFDGAAPATLTQRFATSMDAPGDLRYTYQLSDIKVTAAGAALAPQVTSDGGYTTVSIPTQGVTGPVELSYVAKGAALLEETGETTVSWRLLQGLSLPVRQFTAEVTVPTMIKLVDCQAGPPATPGACTFYGGGTHDHPNPFFSDGPRGAGEVVNIVVRFPAGTVASNQDVRQLWTFGRAFSVTPWTLGTALALALLGGLAVWFLHRRFGRDAVAGREPVRIAEFHPVGPGEAEFKVLDGVRPGQVGTVVDERVDPVDVTATLLDLAVRGHLRITELPRTNPHAATDWTFTRQAGGDELAGYEKTLLDAVAPDHGEPVHVSGLGPAVAAVIGVVQSQLYDDVVARGWFARRPDQTRNTWGRLGWIALGAAVVITILVAAFSTFGLVGLALVLVALGVLWVAQEMPARTAQGAALVNGLGLLSAQLHGQPTDQMPKGREIAELSEIVPYAVVLGGADRWLAALVAADDDDIPDGTDLSWYHAPDDWHLSDLPASLGNFITTVQGTLFSR